MRRETPFFVGYLPVPGPLRAFLISLICSSLGFALVLALLLAGTANDPGAGGFVGRASAVGVLLSDPYPVVHVVESARLAPGTALILSGGGKRGVQGRAGPLDGQMVEVSGQLLERGDLLGLQLRGGARGLRAAEGDATPVPVRDLGRWRLVGEICDGKCLNGAMRPGTGLAHKACANLCLLGGVPPVFVATDRVEGSEFFLIAGPNGGAMPQALLAQTGVLVELEGQVERRGALNVLLVAPESVRVAR